MANIRSRKSSLQINDISVSKVDTIPLIEENLFLLTHENFRGLDSINIVTSDDEDIKYFELAYFSQEQSKSNLSFQETLCTNRKTVKVKCNTLECGARPQIVKHIARYMQYRTYSFFVVLLH